MVNTTLDVIKFLPLEESFKKELLDSYEGLDPEKKYNIGMMLWSAYNNLYNMKLEHNMQIALEEAKENREKLDEGLYRRVRDLTNDEMNRLTAEDIKATDLDMTREKLKEIISSETT